MTSKPGKLYIHILDRPRNGRLLIPAFSGKALKARLLDGGTSVAFRQSGQDVWISLPAALPDDRNTVIALDYSGTLQENHDIPLVAGNQYETISLPSERGATHGATEVKRFTHSYYFGDWKHATCAANMRRPEDSLSYQLRFTEPGITR